jgi:CubicO group peptidase (beta-lactamase class C family)
LIFISAYRNISTTGRIGQGVATALWARLANHLRDRWLGSVVVGGQDPTKARSFKAVGMADREEKTPMTTDAIFRIASMTKPIISVAIVMLYEQGKLGLTL